MKEIRQLLFLVGNDVKSRFAGSRLGVLWAIASPAVTIGIYWFVYTVALQGADVGGVPYLFFLIAGILPWFFFAEGLLGATASFLDYRFLVCKIRFQIQHLPFLRVCSSFLIHLILLLISYLLLSLWGVPVQVGQLWLLFWMAGGFFLTLALGRIFSLLNACLKDVGYGLSVAVQLGFWLTPIFWDPAVLPAFLSPIWVWNPAAILVEGYRCSLLFGNLPELSHILIFWGEALLFYSISILLMKKIKPTLSDRL